MGSINKQISRYEITAVFTQPDAKADIVLVHGLNGSPDHTWTAKNGRFWPTDLLPTSLKDARANILVYGYNADVFSGRNDRSASDNFIHEHAQTLVTHLTLYRKSEGTSTNPIIWVAHSLGGLLVKRSLLYSNDINGGNYNDARSIFVSTYGIVFLGTPHLGSDLATWGRVLQSMSDAVIPRKMFETESALLKTLKKDNEALQNINSHFLDVYQRFKIHMAHECHKTDLKYTKTLVVDANSASPQLPGVTYYGIEATHSGMCKFESASAPGYRNVSTAIHDWIEEASPVIATRWDIEYEERRARARQEAAEKTREYDSPIGSHSSGNTRTESKPTKYSHNLPLDIAMPFLPLASPVDTASTTIYASQSGSSQDLTLSREPPFVHPARFRPNSFFKGREEELRNLHLMLMDEKRRSEGTSAVLVQGIPGAGKTHLARQYVFSHKGDYPAGIYWIRSTTTQDMEDGFWRIAKNVVISDMANKGKRNELSDPQKMVDIVRDWFNDHDGWLLVFDGIRFDDRQVRDFIPDRKNSSLIFTSTEIAVAGNHLLDNPSVMELGLLPAEVAQELLLEEMGKRSPYTPDDLRRTLELVQLMDCLPLMIHAAAQQMKATREPLAKYLKGFRDKPRVGMLPAYKTIRDQLQDRGDTAALNLVYILSFFSQMVPVEMLALGLTALDKRTPVKTDTTGKRRSLAITLVTLIKFAIIERNEMDDKPSSGSRSSKLSADIPAEPLDILRIHSVVQAFFNELLEEEKQLAFWLERAIRVFCRSFDEADLRMKKDPATGLPDDYRRYAIHGKKLMEHLDRHHRAKETPKSNDVDLATAQSDLEERLARLPEEIEDLQRNLSSSIIDGKGVAEHSSVFERSNSMSSQSTDHSNDPCIPQHGCLREGDHIQHDFPATYDDPNHFHFPYVPQAVGGKGAQAEELLPDDGITTPYPPDTVIGHYSDVEEFESMPVSKHRSVKKMERRRYRDRAGSWRETTIPVKEPRVSVSRESARGLISPPRSSRGGRSPSRSRISAESEAEAELIHLNKLSPVLPRGGGYIQDKGRSSSAGTVASTRPWPTLGRSTYAQVLSGTAFEDDAPASPAFSKPPSRAGTIDRTAAYDTVSVTSLQTANTKTASLVSGIWQIPGENQPPLLATGPVDEPRPSERSVSKSTQEAHSTLQPFSIWQRFRRQASESKHREIGSNGKTRHKRSRESLKSLTPASRSSQHPPTTHQEGTRTANSSPGAPRTPFYPPGLSVVTNNTRSLRRGVAGRQNASVQLAHGFYTGDFDDENLSRSDPSLGSPTMNVSSPATMVPWNPAPSRPPDGYTSQPMSRNPSSNPPGGGMTGSSGTPLSSNSAGSRENLARPRAPSLVETEPSPRLQPFDIPQTSYQAWAERNMGHRRGESLFGGSNVPASHWLSRAQIPCFEAPQGSPDMKSPRHSPRIGAGGENMTRSGSGGIRVGDGRVIAFGDVPVDIEEAGRRWREDWNRLERTAAEAVNASHTIRAGGDGAESPPGSAPVGLGILPG